MRVFLKILMVLIFMSVVYVKNSLMFFKEEEVL